MMKAELERKGEDGGTDTTDNALRAVDRIVLSGPPAAAGRRAAGSGLKPARARIGRALKLFSVAAIWMTATPLLLGFAAAAWYAVDPVSFSDAWLGTAAFVERLVWSPTSTPT